METYGRWTVVKFVDRDQKNNGRYLCRCECGTEKIVRLTHIKSGKSKSCGCLSSEITGSLHRKHGLSHTRLYDIWKTMKRRCSDSKFPSYKHYGARGISVCEDWLKIDKFYKWALNNGYEEHLTIERVDNNGNYEPSNCTWITHKEQQLNKRNSLVVK